MADRFSVANMVDALKRKTFPTVTLWNRVEGRPRTMNFERALRTEVRDALWMLARQWQVGEFRGEDAGSPTFARVHIETTRLTRFKPGDASPIDFDETVPLETQVERLPWHLTIGGARVALDVRISMGRRWLKLIAAIGNYEAAFVAKYRFVLPDPTQPSDAAVCAHPEVWQAFAAVANRAVDGAALYQYLTAADGHHAYDGLAVLDAHKDALDAAATAFVAWVESWMARPPDPQNTAWQPARLEYRFACATPAAHGETVYVADEFYQGTLDWHSLDVDPSLASIDARPGSNAGSTVTARNPAGRSFSRTMIPVPVAYAGMPHSRWWTIEDGRTNFGEIRPDTTDLAKLLFIEFGLVYSNDWFIVPVTLDVGSIARVRGLIVNNVFGERFWIEAAGQGPDNQWQRWSMYTISGRGQPATSAHTELVLLPTVPKVQESAPLEEVLLIRDEIANMVWAIEQRIPAPDGIGRSGAAAGRETRAYFERLVEGEDAGARLLENEARIRYQVMTTVPEHWIPFIPVRAYGSARAVDLQRAAMLRIIKGDNAPPRPVQARTSLLRTGLDLANPAPYFIREEEVPRAGAIVSLGFQRARWIDGRVLLWSGVRKQTGRGEGSSGLAFDGLADIPAPGNAT